MVFGYVIILQFTLKAFHQSILNHINHLRKRAYVFAQIVLIKTKTQPGDAYDQVRDPCVPHNDIYTIYTS